MIENKKQLVQLLMEILSEKHHPKKNKLQKNKPKKNKVQKNKFRKPKELEEEDQA